MDSQLSVVFVKTRKILVFFQFLKRVSISSCGIRLPLCVPRTSLPCIVAQISVLVMTNADEDEDGEDDGDENEQDEQEKEDEDEKEEEDEEGAKRQRVGQEDPPQVFRVPV